MIKWQPTHQHVKGGYYQHLHLGLIEATMQPAVIYKSQDGTVWVRPLEDFNNRFRGLTQEEAAAASAEETAAMKPQRGGI